MVQSSQQQRQFCQNQSVFTESVSFRENFSEVSVKTIHLPALFPLVCSVM